MSWLWRSQASSLRVLAWGEVWINQWQAANLLKPSAIKPVFATLEQNLILKRLGALHPSDQAVLRQAIGLETRAVNVADPDLLAFLCQLFV